MHVGDSSMYFTANATDGMARAAASCKWNAGEHLVITDAEHNSVPANARDIQSEHPGVSFSVAEVRHLFTQPNFEEQWLQAIVDQVANNTRLVIVGEVLWDLGLVLPVKELVARCKAKNPQILVMVDGAHGLGQLPVDVKALGCDMYATAGHSWLGGPSGSGIMAVTNALNARRSEFRLRIRRGWGEPESGRRASRAVDPNWGRDSNPQIDFSAVHQGTFLGLGAALDFYEGLGVAAVSDRVRSLATMAAARLSNLSKVSLLPTPDIERQTGIVAFAADGVSDQAQAEALVSRLERDFKVICRWVGNPPLIRVCFHYYNNEDDIDALCGGLSEVL
jgi:L-cysteine/cystine lyase